MKIGVIGLGKAGLPLAAVIAENNIQVIGIDIDQDRVNKINSGINPIPEEEGLSELLKKHGGNNLTASSNPEDSKDCNVHIVIVPLFIDDNNNPEFSIIKTAFESLSKHIKKEDIIILETTVPPGTTENLVKDILEAGSGLKAGTDFYLAYSPERIMTGQSISRYKEFPKLIGGINNQSTDKAYEIYKNFSNPIKVSDSKTAELTKVSEGIYRDVNIALANELYKVAEEYDINFWELKKAAKHEFCNILEPGNVGGHCIPVYPWFLINNLDVPLIKTARELNDSMLIYYLKKINEREGNKIGIIGLSYRNGVKEKAFSRSVDLIKLLEKGNYDIFGIDPLFSKEETESQFKIKYLENFEDMDIIIVMNSEPSFKEKLLPLKDKVIDIKNILQ